MSSQAKSRETAPPARPNQKTFLDEVIMTFSSPMAWLLVVALILTWSGVAIVLFDLLDYKTLAGICTRFIALFNPCFITILHHCIVCYVNSVYSSLKSHVFIHFQQPFRHFWYRLQKCFHENIITSCLLLAKKTISISHHLKHTFIIFSTECVDFQVILSHIHILISLIVQLNVHTLIALLLRDNRNFIILRISDESTQLSSVPANFWGQLTDDRALNRTHKINLLITDHPLGVLTFPQTYFII